MMGTMSVILLILVLLALVVVAAAAGGAFALATRRAEAAADADRRRLDDLAERDAAVQESIREAVAVAVADAREHATAERDAAVQAALEQSAVLQREQMAATVKRHNDTLQATAVQVKEQTSAELGSKQQVIEARLDQVHGEMRSELTKLAQLVSSLGETSAQKFGEVDTALRAHMEITTTLSESTQSLRSALANPQARGQWGERMAEDVLRLAGFVEHVNYEKQTQIDGGTGRPDFTFNMPKGQTLFMDVKFPMASYLRYLEAGTDAERETHLKRFLADVRARVKELAKREYAVEGGGSAVDNVLLFIPNEQLTGFIHEHDPALIEDAMSQQIVMCSPLTLFAFLGVIRQAHDNFMVEQTSDEILKLIGTFGTEWEKYTEQADKVKKRFDAVEKEFDLLVGRRRRVLERPLRQLDELRRARDLPVDGQLFTLADGDEDETPPDGALRQLGA